MSKGHGRIQRAILELIEMDPDGAWSIEQFCWRIYGQAMKAQRVAVGRALARIALPGTWSIGYFEQRWWLYDECNLESVRKSRPGWDKAHFEPGGEVFDRVEKAKRFRDASPLKRIEMEIAGMQTAMAMLKGFGMLTTEGKKDASERIKELEKQKAELQAQT